MSAFWGGRLSDLAALVGLLSVQILFLGAEFTQVYATEYGSGIRPERELLF